MTCRAEATLVECRRALLALWVLPADLRGPRSASLPGFRGGSASWASFKGTNEVVCWGSSVIHQDSQDSENLSYAHYGVLWQKDTDRNRQREKLHRAETGRNQARASSCPCPLESRGSTLPATMPGLTFEVGPTRGAHCCVGMRGLYWESALWAWSAASLTLSARSPAPQRSNPYDVIQSPRCSS